MSALPRLLLQVLTGAVLGGLIAAFSAGPEWRPVPPGHGRLTLAIAHLSDRRTPCRQLDEAERMALPPTRRVNEVCERARKALHARLVLGGEVLFEQQLEPTGLHRDGRIYRIERWALPAGRYDLEFTLTESGQARADLALQQQFELAPAAALVLDVADRTLELLHADAVHRPEDLK